MANHAIVACGPRVQMQRNSSPIITQTYTGDQRAPLKANGTYDWDVTAWEPDGTLIGGVAEAGFNDVIYASGGADRIDGLGGNDALDGNLMERIAA